MNIEEVPSESNRRLVQNMYDAAKRGDVNEFFSALAADIVVYEPPFLHYGGIYRGHTEFSALFGKLSALIDISGLRIDCLVSSDERVIGLLYLPFKDGSGGMSLAEESVIQMNKIVEMRIYVHDAGPLIKR